MANYSQSFGYQTFLVPLRSSAVDLAALEHYTTFIDQFQAVSGPRALLVTGTGDHLKMAYGGSTSHTVSNVSLQNNVVTITTSDDHGLIAGDLVSVSVHTNIAVNGMFVVKAAPTTKTLTYDMTGTNITAGADTGTLTGGTPLKLDGTDKPILLKGLTDCALTTDTNSESVTTYDDETQGYQQSLATSKSFSLEIAGVTDFRDLGYKVVRMVEKHNVSSQLMGKLVRVGPVGTTEATFGYVRLTNFKESNKAGSVTTWSVTANGYGPYEVELDN